MTSKPNLHENIDAVVILTRTDGSEFRMPGSFKRLLVEAFSDIAEANSTAIVPGELPGDHLIRG
ncbi:hypothetical protein [Pseudorhizobium flavum]|uniref:hypothetical protein n=1 Tax=Pseudorhizobium flavum TaxID=1335061 RepID=UPI00376F6CBB